MAFKMRGFNPGQGTNMGSAFLKSNPLKSNGEPDWSKMNINATSKKQPVISKKSIGFDHDEVVKKKALEEHNKRYDKHGNVRPVEFGFTPDVGPGKILKGGKKLFDLGKKFFGNKKAIQSTAKNVSKGTKKQTPPRKLPHYGDIKTQKNIDDVINVTKARGKMYDDLYAKKPWQWGSRNFTKAPSISGREMVDLSVKGLPPQRFYRSTGLGGKTIKGKSSKGKWVPLEGFGDLSKMSPQHAKKWFVKIEGWDK